MVWEAITSSAMRAYALRGMHNSAATSIATHLIQAEIKNAFHANNFQYLYDPDELAAGWTCVYCGGYRSMTSHRCEGCGAPRTHAPTRI